MVDSSDSSRPRLAVVVSHPIQYQAPVFRALAARTPVDVFFAHRLRTVDQRDAGFTESMAWDVDLFNGYRARYLTNRARRPGVDRFNGCHTPAIGKVLAQGRYECCLVFGWYLRTYWQAIRACGRLQIPVLVYSDTHEVIHDKLGARLKRWMKLFLLRRVDGYCVPGERARRFLIDQGIAATKIFNVAHSVDVAAIRETSRMTANDSEHYRNALNIDPGSRVVLCVAKLVPGKRLHDVVQAIALLQRQSPSAVHYHLVIVGSGALGAAIDAATVEQGVRATLAGFVNQRELPKYYGLCDVLVVPSESESWGLVVNEALAAGLPAVVSDRIGCAQDFTRRTVRVKDYPCGDIKQLAACIAEVSELQRANFLDEDYRRLTTQYSPHTAAGQFMRAIDQTLSRGEAALAPVQPYRRLHYGN